MRSLVLGCLVLLLAVPSLGRELNQLPLETGRDPETNGLPYALLDGNAGAPVRFEPIAAAYDREAQVIRKIPGDKAKSWIWTLAPDVDLGVLFTDALRTEAAAMGVRAAGAGDSSSWVIRGRLSEIYLDSRVVGLGTQLYYGYSLVEGEVVPLGGGEASSFRWAFHNRTVHFSHGMGVRDEATEALAHFLLTSAQEMVARLNRHYLHLPPTAAAAALVAPLGSVELDEPDLHLRLVGLAGAREAVPRLLSWLAREKNEDLRTPILEALALLGAPEAIAPLTERFAGEDEDCQFSVLKALDYLGTPEADAALVALPAELKDPAAKSRLSRLKQGRKARP